MSGIDFEVLAESEAQWVDVMDGYVIWRLRYIHDCTSIEDEDVSRACKLLISYMEEPYSGGGVE